MRLSVTPLSENQKTFSRVWYLYSWRTPIRFLRLISPIHLSNGSWSVYDDWDFYAWFISMTNCTISCWKTLKKNNLQVLIFFSNTFYSSLNITSIFRGYVKTSGFCRIIWVFLENLRIPWGFKKDFRVQ